jgi:hypothetical protein
MNVLESIMSSDLSLDYTFFKNLSANLKEFIFEKWYLSFEEGGDYKLDDQELISIFELTKDDVNEQLFEQELICVSVDGTGAMKFLPTELGKERNVKILR